MTRLTLLLIAALTLTAVAWLRGPEYDEAYSMFLTAGNARPGWPAGIFTPEAVRGLYNGHAGFMQIAHDLRAGDVHPPLYFWALEIWRRLVGPSWLAARLFSVLCTLGALALLGQLAALAEIPAATAMLIALAAYGFTYAGIVARGFALAQFFNILGVTLIFAAWRRDRRMFALAGGLSLGAASFTNYLAVFTGIAALVWLVFQKPRQAVLAAVGLALFVPADAWFFLAQKSSRAGQFQVFSPRHALALLAKDSGAALFGGLPVYAGAGGAIVAFLLLLLFMICLLFVLVRRPPNTALFAVTAIATPLGLLALGFVFDNTPIEIRYLAFSVPFLALLFAAVLPRAVAALFIMIGACAILGLAIAPATMQPQGATARAAAASALPGTLVLLPFGNDGVGIPGPFIAASPDGLRLELVRPGSVPDFFDERRIILAMISGDAASRLSNAQLSSYVLGDPCWRRMAAAAPDILIYDRICTAH